MKMLKEVAKDIRTVMAGIGWFNCEEAQERVWNWTEQILKKKTD